MQINLTKPLAFIDLETTGLTIGHDKIVEIGIIKVNTNNETEEKLWRINPEMPIPEKVSMLHGIYNKDVADKPTFKQLGNEIAGFIGNADIAGYNSNKFDIPMLVEEFMKAEIDFDIQQRKLIDVQNIFHFMEPRNLSAAYKFYCEKTLINAHSAMADAKATYEIFKSQLEKYKDRTLENEKGEKYQPIQNNIELLSKLTSLTRNADLAGRIVFNDKGQEVFNFGKHKDKLVADVFEKEPSYYTWMMNGDFPLYTKRIITQIRTNIKK
ncbi:MAG: 3'-5' exonuclease [Bacteroidetes bacterium]|nr:3'-5' exonuclease [Bacteroidota bacterium]